MIHLLVGTDICSSVCSKRIYQKLETSDSYPGCKDTALSWGLEWVLMRGNNPVLYSFTLDCQQVFTYIILYDLNCPESNIIREYKRLNGCRVSKEVFPLSSA